MDDDDVDSVCTGKLGTREYWKDAYQTELQNFKDYGDIGDIWFGKGNVERIVKWLDDRNISHSCPVLDIGCGNGMMLLRLLGAGFVNLSGIDYVEEAVELAAFVMSKNTSQAVTLEVVDFLSDISSLPPASCLHKKYKIVIDKGTYDAIGMCPIDSHGKRKTYREHTLQLLDSDGVFIIVSCNWTKEELIAHFKGFRLLDEIATPAIMFGGKSGHMVTSLILQKCETIHN